MSSLVDQAIEALHELPEPERERIAWEIIERVGNKTEWANLVTDGKAREWLETQARKALEEYDRIKNKTSMNFIAIPQDNLFREQTYWGGFDELPADIRRLAEENYRLWKENPRDARLRVKKIHPSLPIFSFRVGLRHRTVGVETDDGKIAWFWVGSIDGFREMLDL